MEQLPKVVREIPFSDTEIHTWFERDRSHVELREKSTDRTLVEWWDEDVTQAIEDGFLKPRDFHGSAYEYALERGMLKKRRTMRKNPVSRHAKQVLKNPRSKQSTHHYWLQTQAPAGNWVDNMGSASRNSVITHGKWLQKEHGETVRVVDRTDTVIWVGQGKALKNPTQFAEVALHSLAVQAQEKADKEQRPYILFMDKPGHYIVKPFSGYHSGPMELFGPRKVNKNPDKLRKLRTDPQGRFAYYARHHRTVHGREPTATGYTSPPKGKKVHLQMKKDQMWITLAIALNNTKGRNRITAFAKRYHRQHPGSTLRLFV